MPRGRPRKNPVKIEPKKEQKKAEPEAPAVQEQTKRGRKPSPKEYPVCEFCGEEIRDGNPREIKFNQLAGTGEYRFRAVNTKPKLCANCWNRTVRAFDNWLLKNGIPEKFVDGRGHRTEAVIDETSGE